MLLSTRGIVFRTVKYGETSVIADIYTEEKGLHTFIAGAVRSAKSRMPFGLFQPMSVVEMVSYFREDSNALHRMKELRAGEVWRAIPFDLRRGAIALFMAEVCRKCIHEAEPHQDLFEFLLDNLRLLDAAETPVANIHLHFLAHLPAFLGFQPEFETLDLDENPQEMFFDLREGVFTASVPPHNAYAEPAETAHLLALLQTPLGDCHEIALDKTARKALLQCLTQFYQQHVPSFDAINTPAILELVMG